MMKKILMTGLLALAASPAFSGDPIEGEWEYQSSIIRYDAAGGGKYCGTYLNGSLKGQSFGCFKSKNGKYKGNVKYQSAYYPATAVLKSNKLYVKGCEYNTVCKRGTLTRR